VKVIENTITNNNNISTINVLESITYNLQNEIQNMQSSPASVDNEAQIQAVLQLVQTLPNIESIDELRKQIQALELTSRAELELTEIQRQIQALELAVRPELGTMAALQQDNLPWVQFNTLPQGFPTGPLANGTVYWDDADAIKTLNIVMEDSGEVIQHIGEETYYRVKASSNITNGQVVMFTGTVGASGGLRGAPATGLTAFQNEYVMGIATQDILLNDWGYVTWFGEVKKLDTAGGVEAWVDGQILYYDPAVPGGLTKNVPSAPNPKVIVANVIHAAAANGILFVRPTFGSALGSTDSNVEITGLANTDLLQYDSIQARWENIPAADVIANTLTAPVTKVADFTVAAGEKWIINNKSGSTCTATLPTASTNVGRVLNFQNYQAQTLVSASSNVVPLVGGAATTAILTAVAGDTATLVSDGTNWVMTQYTPNNVLLLE
jgi:hypothetical protein